MGRMIVTPVAIMPVTDRRAMLAVVGGVRVLYPGLALAAPAKEGHEHEPPRIECGERRRDVDAPEGVKRAEAMRYEGGLDDRVLRYIAGETERGERDADPGQGQRADRHHPEGEGDLAPEAAHATHVLLMVHRGYDRTRAEEEQRLEEGVGEQVKDGEAVAADPEADKHVSELGAGRIGDDALDVVLHEAHGRREKGRRRAHN